MIVDALVFGSKVKLRLEGVRHISSFVASIKNRGNTSYTRVFIPGIEGWFCNLDLGLDAKPPRLLGIGNEPLLYAFVEPGEYFDDLRELLVPGPYTEWWSSDVRYFTIEDVPNSEGVIAVGTWCRD